MGKTYPDLSGPQFPHLRLSTIIWCELAMVESRQMNQEPQGCGATQWWSTSLASGRLWFVLSTAEKQRPAIPTDHLEHPTQRGAKPCEDCTSCTGLTTLARKKCRSPGTEGEGDTRGMGWLRAAGGGWGCWCDVALSRFSSFQLSPLVSSSSRGLVALSMSYRQSDTDQSIGSRGKAGGSTPGS